MKHGIRTVMGACGCHTLPMGKGLEQRLKRCDSRPALDRRAEPTTFGDAVPGGVTVFGVPQTLAALRDVLATQERLRR